MTATLRRAKRWTYADYRRIPTDRLRHEIIDGRHYVNPAPSPYHQAVSVRLLYQLFQKIELAGLGRVFDAPIDVHLGRGTVVQPDLVVLRNRKLSQIGQRKLTGVPDMLVEILSPSNRGYDRRTKKRRYERAGVREFWIVDPEAKVVEQCVLRGCRYADPVVSSTAVRLQILRDVAVELGGIW